MKKAYHYVYIITNIINKKFYIGKHSTNDLEDDYMGSGIAIKRAIKKHGILNFKKRILCYCDTAEDALKVEEFLITEYIVSRDDCYNMKCGGKGGSLPGRKMSDESRMKISQALIGNTYNKGKHRTMTDEEKTKRTGENNSMFGKHHSEETKKKISENRKGKGPAKGEGHKHSEETKKKMSEIRKGKPTWNKGLVTGKHWFTNGTLDTLSYICPEGFVPGRKLKRN